MAARYTRRHLIDQVIANLHVLASGQTPSDEDVYKVDQVIDPCRATLEHDGITNFNDVGRLGPIGGEIEDWQFLPFAAIVTDAAAASFNMAGDPQFYQLARQAEERLKTLARPPRLRRELQIDRSLWSRRVRGAYNGF